jgi:hypothetical protein
VRSAGRERDPDLQHQPELRWYHDQYPEWRSLFDGSALEEKISTSQDPATDSDQGTYRWPVRYNLVHSYCLLHAGMLWGRGRTGAESNQLFTLRVDPKAPGKKAATAAAPDWQDTLEYFWAQQSHVLRPCGITQQWAGGCVLKVNWNPWAPTSVLGIQLEMIQPDHFYPIWDPTSFENLYAVKIKFGVSKAVAIAKYGVSAEQLRQFNETDPIPVEEYWDSERYHVVLGKMDPKDKGIPARRMSDGQLLQGPNPWKHPVTGRGVIPFVYVPRIRTGGFMGDSLAYHLQGLQAELNKTLADYGDALTGGAHPSFGISDFRGPGGKDKVIAIPRNGALNMGPTRPGGIAPKVHEFPKPEVPPQTGEFVDRLLSLSEAVAGLTPAARGIIDGSKSGIAVALQMLPTTNLVDWERSHWGQAIAGRGGIDEIAAVIWWHKAKLTDFAPPVPDTIFGLRQEMEFLPVVPRDRLDVVDEVVRLATANAVSPQEWLKRLGDIKDIDAEMKNLIGYLTWKAMAEAAVAGRVITVSTPTNPESPTQALPEVKAEPQPAMSQPAKEPEGLSQRKDTAS